MKIKAITLYPPWAALIAVGAKKIETRSWSTRHRGSLAIHAGANVPGPIKKQLVSFGISSDTLNGLPLGAIVALATLKDCVPITSKFIVALSQEELTFGDYHTGRYAWILDNIRRLPVPIPARGRQRLWDWEFTVEAMQATQAIERAGARYNETDPRR